MDQYSSYEWHASRRQLPPRGESSGSGERERRERGDRDHDDEDQHRDRDRDRGHERGRTGHGHGHEAPAPRRPVITRVNRACNGCRRAKIRCIGGDTPPCERCAATGAECVLEKPAARPALSAGAGPEAAVVAGMESRMHGLEVQVTAMRAMLEDVVRAVCPEVAPRGGGRASRDGDGDTHEPFQETRSAHWGNRSPPQPPPELRKLHRQHGLPGNDEHEHQRGERFGYSNERGHLRHSRSATPGKDVLAIDEIANPLGGMSTMATRMDDDGGGGGDGHQHRHPDDLMALPRKRRRVSPANDPDDTVSDPVSLGLIHADEASALVDMFFAGCSDFINCYDPARDHYAALLRRSPFSLTAVMMTGARVRDGGGGMSHAQRVCVDTARRMAMRTLVRPGAGVVEDVKALVLLAAFADDGWLMAGHAVRLALELGLNLAFGKLASRGMGKGLHKLTSAEHEEEQSLVEAARVWYAVYRLEHQMSYGMGRPAIVQEDETIHTCRALLSHPLTLDQDVRLIYAVELLALRAPLHGEMNTGAHPDAPLDAGMLGRLAWGNEQFDAWERHWYDVVLERTLARGQHADAAGWVRESLLMQRQLAELFLNSQLLRGVHSQADLATMDDEKRAFALRAIRNAERCMDIALRGRHYSKGLPFGTHYTHVCFAFAASFLVRIARFFPDELDLVRVAEDVEEAATVLSTLPAGRYARSLRLLLRKARRENIFPPAAQPAHGERPAAAIATSSSTSLRIATPVPATTTAASDTLAPAPTPANWFTALDLNIDSVGGMDPDDPLLGLMGLDKDAPLPLFLSGELGAAADPEGMPDAAGFTGLEAFFVPAELDEFLLTSLPGDGVV